MTENKFLVDVDHMSLWELSHRWANKSPDESLVSTVPVEVQDILRSLMRAQTLEFLQVADERGHVYKDSSIHAPWQNFGEDSDNEWTKRDQQRQYISDIVAPREQFIEPHYEIIRTRKFNPDYLESVHVEQENFVAWVILEDLPFPTFWISDIAKTDFLQELLVREKHKESYEDGYDKPNKRLVQKINLMLKNKDEDGVGSHIPQTKGRLRVNDIDSFWSRLNNAQKDRLMVRSVVKQLWQESPDKTVEEIKSNPIIKLHLLGGRYSNKDTIRDWIRDLDPRPPETKRGPKRNTRL